MVVVTALSIFVVLTIVALLHAYWAFGGRWPGHDELSLARTVVGSKGITAMPARGPTLVVAVQIFLAGVVASARAGLVPTPLPATAQTVALAALATVFLVRGIAGFTPMFRALQSEEPFATLDRRLYSPLCLALGIGFAILVA
ncbi:MAG: DUF3995 domain-containing protein [Phyllobacteriaceae bacterium]|nr:DUF3995 domain-containing protein [Phyllobacteriaceae bacterium]